MNMSSPEGLKPRTPESVSREEDSEDEATERIPRAENPYAMPSAAPDTSNREKTDPNQLRRAFVELSDGGTKKGMEGAVEKSNIKIKSADAAMETALIKDGVDILRAKVEAGRDPNELLEHIFAELQGVEDEIEDLTEGDQRTMLIDAEMRKARLVAQFRWLQGHLEQER